MPNPSKTLYLIAASTGVIAWTGAIISVAHLPLVTELALGAMGIVGAIWGHAVLFPRDRPPGEVAAPGGASHEEVLDAMGVAAQPSAARPARRPRSNLPLHVNQAARQEALRISEALNAIGVFGPVSVRLEAGGTALIAPVQEGEPVRVSAALVQHFAARALAAPEAADRLAQNPGWPGAELAAALAAHIDLLERQMPRRLSGAWLQAAPDRHAARRAA